MNNLHKTFTALTAMMIFVAVFSINAEPAVSLQSSKTNITQTKTVKKRIITPNQACKFLNDLDMPTRPYSDMWGKNSYGKYEADSDKFILESRDPNRYLNNLSYSVFGDKFIAKAVELDLNVNDLSYKANAVETLIKYSDDLMFKVTGKKLTPEIKKAMQKQTSGEWTVNGYKIQLKVDIGEDEEIIKDVEPSSDHGAFSLAFLIEL